MEEISVREREEVVTPPCCGPAYSLFHGGDPGEHNMGIWIIKQKLELGFRRVFIDQELPEGMYGIFVVKFQI